MFASYNNEKNNKENLQNFKKTSPVVSPDSDYSHSQISSNQYEGGGRQKKVANLAKEDESDIDNIDFDNFKGIYFDEDPNRKYQDPDTGCHFEYNDLCKRLIKLKALRKKLDHQLGLPPESPENEYKSSKNPQKKASSHERKDNQNIRVGQNRLQAISGNAIQNQTFVGIQAGTQPSMTQNRDATGKSQENLLRLQQQANVQNQNIRKSQQTANFNVQPQNTVLINQNNYQPGIHSRKVTQNQVIPGVQNLQYQTTGQAQKISTSQHIQHAQQNSINLNSTQIQNIRALIQNQQRATSIGTDNNINQTGSKSSITLKQMQVNKQSNNQSLHSKTQYSFVGQQPIAKAQYANGVDNNQLGTALQQNKYQSQSTNKTRNQSIYQVNPSGYNDPVALTQGVEERKPSGQGLMAGLVSNFKTTDLRQQFQTNQQRVNAYNNNIVRTGNFVPVQITNGTNSGITGSRTNKLQNQIYAGQQVFAGQQMYAAQNGSIILDQRSLSKDSQNTNLNRQKQSANRISNKNHQNQSNYNVGSNMNVTNFSEQNGQNNESGITKDRKSQLSGFSGISNAEKFVGHHGHTQSHVIGGQIKIGMKSRQGNRMIDDEGKHERVLSMDQNEYGNKNIRKMGSAVNNKILVGRTGPNILINQQQLSIYPQANQLNMQQNNQNQIQNQQSLYIRKSQEEQLRQQIVNQKLNLGSHRQLINQIMNQQQISNIQGNNLVGGSRNPLGLNLAPAQAQTFMVAKNQNLISGANIQNVIDSGSLDRLQKTQSNFANSISAQQKEKQKSVRQQTATGSQRGRHVNDINQGKQQIGAQIQRVESQREGISNMELSNERYKVNIQARNNTQESNESSKSRVQNDIGAKNYNQKLFLEAPMTNNWSGKNDSNIVISSNNQKNLTNDMLIPNQQRQ